MSTQPNQHIPKVIAIVGPTASGKSALGLFLAQKLHGEIISADSRQIYRGMEIITRTPSKKELRSIPHHLIAFLHPRKAFSAGEFAKKGERIIAAIVKRGNTPIVVGGTGFYADALLRGLSLPKVPPHKKLRTLLKTKSPAQLLAMLKKIDAASAARVDPHNHVRLIRAIEIARALGTVPQRVHTKKYDVLWLGCTQTKIKHAHSIERGIEKRMHKGMLSEAKKLREQLPRKRLLSLGFEYRLLDDFLNKKFNKKELVKRLVQEEQKYAKRQMRWFKRDANMQWVQNKSEALRLAKNHVADTTQK